MILLISTREYLLQAYAWMNKPTKQIDLVEQTIMFTSWN